MWINQFIDTARFAARLSWERRVGRMRPTRIAALQRRRLRRLVAWAAARSPFYGARYRGLDPQRFELPELPPVTKAEMMEHFDGVPTDRRLRRDDLEEFTADPARLGQWYLGRYAVSRTSGTQGMPALVVQDRRAVELYFALQVTRGSALRSDPAAALGRLVRRARLAVVTVGGGFYPSAAAMSYVPPGLRGFVDLLWLNRTEPLAEVVEALNRFRPEALAGYASTLEALARESLAGRLRPGGLRQVTSVSEPLTRGARRLIESAFGVTVLDNYSCGECLALSFGCPRGHGMHLQADWAVLEVVDRHYRPVAPGRAGDRVLVTNLSNYVQPFIRYELPDVVTLSPGPCPCGSPLPLILRVEGRSDEVVWVRDGDRYRQVHPYVFTHALEGCPGAGAYQVVQPERNRFLVRAAPAPGRRLARDDVAGAVRRGLRDAGVEHVVELEVEVTDRVGPDPRTGKLKRISSLVGPPGAAAEPVGA